ncbi:MAG: hypothetical protein CL867_03880 [Cytophagaceae bacterium]|nr:hypothetical protein [Cytophagaceae bacterium]
MKQLLLIFGVMMMWPALMAQNVQIDGRLQPLLQEFRMLCDEYQIDTHDKLFALTSIDIVNTLTVAESGSTLGMLKRNEAGIVVGIEINWMAQLDPEKLRIVAFHEFAHYFLEYEKHICEDCGRIMSVVNSSYFDIVRDWDRQVRILFEQSPAYLKKQGTLTIPMQ